MTVGELRRKLAFVPGDTEITVIMPTEVANHFTERDVALRISSGGRYVFVLPQSPTGAEIEKES